MENIPSAEDVYNDYHFNYKGDDNYVLEAMKHFAKIRVEANKTTWNDPEKQRPYAGATIIFIDSVGLFKGDFHPIKNGVVWIEGKKSDTIQWDDVFQWIYYPEEF